MRKVITKILDDIEQAQDREVEAETTIAFSIDGKSYTIDLCAKNAAKMRSDFKRYVDHAAVAGRAPKGRGPRVRTDATQTAAIRDWARRTGRQVADKGRIPAEVIEEYNQTATASA